MRLSRLTILQMNKNKDVDIDGVVMEFAHLEGTEVSPFASVTSLVGSLFYPFFHKHCTLPIALRDW